MAQIPDRYRLVILAIVDVIVLALVTVYGFATHGTLQTAGQRLPATLLPVIIGWFVVAPFLGAYDLGQMQHWSQLWRPTYAMVLAAPLAAVAARPGFKHAYHSNFCNRFGGDQRPGDPGLAGNL